MAEEDSTINNTLDDSSIKEPEPFTQSLSNGFQRIVTAAVAIGAAEEFFSQVFRPNKASSNFIVPDLAGNGDLGYGATNSAGGLRNNGTMIRYGLNRTPDPSITTGKVAIGYKSLESIIQKTLSMDWKTKNADPGNPNIIEAYKLSGRNYTKDGRTGQYSWATAYVNWVLNKAGLPYLETMSPKGYEKYGTPVNFNTMQRVRKYDIFIFRSIEGITHIGFIKSYDPNTKTLEIIGGNQAGTVKVTKMPFSPSNPQFYVSNVRRNWEIPSDVDASVLPPTKQPKRANNPTPAGVTPVAPLNEITVQPLPPLGATPAEIAEFNNRYPPVPTTDPKAQFGPYRTALGRPSVEDITGLAGAAIGRAENAGPAPTRPRNPRVR